MYVAIPPLIKYVFMAWCLIIHKVIYVHRYLVFKRLTTIQRLTKPKVTQFFQTP